LLHAPSDPVLASLSVISQPPYLSINAPGVIPHPVLDRTFSDVLDVTSAPGAALPYVPDVHASLTLSSSVLDISFPDVLDVTGAPGAPLLYVPDVHASLTPSSAPGTSHVPDMPALNVLGVKSQLPVTSRKKRVDGTHRISERRPNDYLLFAASTGEPLSTQTSLDPKGIANLLSGYPDKKFVDTLVGIASSGARLGYEGPQDPQVISKNHRSAFIQADVITKSIQSEIEKGRMKELPHLPDGHYFCSPIGLIPKTADGVQTGWRVIFDLSSPDQRSVNDGIPPQYGSIVYESLQVAIQLVANAGRGAVIMKRDLKSAFRHVPVSPSDHWLLIFEWQGKYYFDIFLPFGLRTAPRIFNLFSEALHWVFETTFRWNLTHYLDDFLFVFPPGTDISLSRT
jgi:hypothetical protein